MAATAEQAYALWLKQAAFTDVTYLLTEAARPDEPDEPAEHLREVD